MAPPVNYTAQSAIAVMRQVIDTNIELSQNLDVGLDKRIATISAYDVGTEKFRAPLQVDSGGQVAGLSPDGGPLPQGNGAEYLQFIIVPVSHDVAIASTDLMNRISEEAGGDQRPIITDVVARLIAKAKMKMAHFRNCLLQGYNEGILATGDATVNGANPVPLAMLSFGNRLLDLNNVYQATDANMNVLGQVTILAKSKPTGATVDTVTVDYPALIVSGGSLIPLNYASGVPVGPAGLQYLINATQAGDMFGIQRTVEQVQAASANAGTAPLSLGVIDSLEVRKSLSNGMDAEQETAFYYTNPVQRVTANQLGFAKRVEMNSPGQTTQTLDISPNRKRVWTIGGKDVQEDSVAAVDYLYDIAPSLLGKARYPGSQKFMTGPIKGFWYERIVNGQHTTTYDAHFQDSWTVYTRKPWVHAVAHNLGINPALTVAA
jgi:hypothetical protein